MKPAPFEYVAPHSLPEVLRALEQAAGDAKILAGGQSLLPRLDSVGHPRDRRHRGGVHWTR